MNKKTDKTKIVIVITIAIIIAIGYLLVFPQIKEIYQNTDDIITKKQELRLYTEQSTGNLADFTESIIQNSERLKKTILTEGDEIIFVNTLENLASEKNISQQIFVLDGDTRQESSNKTRTTSTKSKTEKVAGTNIEKINFEIVTGSSFQDLLDYIKAIESTELYININNINITRANESGEEVSVPDGGVKASIKATTYIEE